MKNGYIFILLTAFLYSTQEIAGKLISGKLDPFQVNFLIFLIGAIILFPFALKDMKKKNLQLGMKDYGYLALCGVLAVSLAMTALQTSLGFTKASIAAVIFSTNAVFTVPFAFLLLKEKINKTTLLSLLISILGVLIIFNPVKIITNFSGGKELIGIGLALCAAIFFGLYTVVSKMRIEKYGGFVFNFFAFSFGVLVNLFILLIMKKPIFTGISSDSLFVLLYMGIVIKAIGYIFYLNAIRLTSATTASTVFLLKPGLAPFIAVVALGETISTTTGVGIVCILIGSGVGYLAKNKNILTIGKTYVAKQYAFAWKNKK
jgi:drug/metabolite transporter (DMT)-like permease